MSTVQLSIGNELKDSYKNTHSWVQNNIKWLRELETFYKKRAEIEREYSLKLSQLTSEYFNKKSASTVGLSVGDTPSTTPGSIEAATVVTWNEILTQTELVSKDHGKLGQQFESQVAAQIAGLFGKCDITLTKIEAFQNEITQKKTSSVQELEKGKKDYDASCVAMENARNKNTKSPGTKNQNKLNEKEAEMNISKNSYLIKINQSNRIKDKYYFQDVPECLDLLQDLNESRILLLNDIWRKASSYERTLAATVQNRMDASDSVVTQNKPHLSTAMFIKHNVRLWKEPADYVYKPSQVWHDDEKFSVPSEVEANDLRLKLARAKKTSILMMTKQNRIITIVKVKCSKKKIKSEEGENQGQELYEVLKNYLNVMAPFTSHETLKLKAEVEMESIQNNTPSEFDLSIDNINVSSQKKRGTFFKSLTGGLLSNDSPSLVSRSHSKSSKGHLSLFSGLSHKSVHSNEDHDNGISNISENDDSTSTYTTDTTSIKAPQAVIKSSSSSNSNKVLYQYNKQDADEISIDVGDSISLVQADTGSGWTRIKNNTTGEEGLVPTSYVEIKTQESRGPAPVAPPSRRKTTTTRKVQALYDYEAQGDDEISISVGDTITVIKGDDGSGWTFGELNGIKGLFPSSYCK
ncbi:hypothetical protein TPHA_0B02890 [Tetrapisispora phaffii CBS 4417]|uniref:Protein BZZ1 n=1 Tax=Tetrapisispora phaffii (strain ATCC 24235 / CBS 4417 / NBRC 1672 / NRRL Y-8282 / UCD 70-5) TaxID=1071381 RepID=G8BPN0_TETPH|nr:hypothetical protein TPHA_0B02890 [Tetrapisispora phaffii CBS 4417]CCE61961.1 hypothetical protein TPHA_0B02890 [Tetrapisispora phaffii CBS 4417]